MRNRDEIETESDDIWGDSSNQLQNLHDQQKVTVEVLLDIRELLQLRLNVLDQHGV